MRPRCSYTSSCTSHATHVLRIGKLEFFACRAHARLSLAAYEPLPS